MDSKYLVDTNKKQQTHLNESVRRIVIIAATAILFLGGAWRFFSQYEYRDAGQIYTFVAFAVGILGGAFALVKRAHMLSILLIVAGLGGMFYGDAKFAWRRDYMESVQAKKAILLMPYIAEYPSYEDYMFGSFWGAEDPVRLSKDCLEPLLNKQAPMGKCGSLGEIQANYNIDLRNVLSTYFSKMQNTARKVKEKQLTTVGQYAQCIASKECAAIPLLPLGVKAEAIDPSSLTEYYDVRKAYWSLLNDAKLTREVCNFTPLCQAMVQGKLVRADDPLGVIIK